MNKRHEQTRQNSLPKKTKASNLYDLYSIQTKNGGHDKIKTTVHDTLPSQFFLFSNQTNSRSSHRLESFKLDQTTSNNRNNRTLKSQVFTKQLLTSFEGLAKSTISQISLETSFPIVIIYNRTTEKS